MADFTIFGRPRVRALFIIILAAGLLITFASAIRYETPLDGLPNREIRQLNFGWFYMDGENKTPVTQLPCSTDTAGDTLCIVRDIGKVHFISSFS